MLSYYHNSCQKLYRKQSVLIPILIAFYLTLNLLFLKTVPRFYYDEAWHASLGYNLAFEGKMRMDIFDEFGGVNIRYVQDQLVAPWVIGFFYKVGGFGVTTTRLGSVAMSLLAVIAVFKFCSRCFGTSQAFGMALLTMIHPWFFEISRRARPEIYFVALTLLGLWLFLNSLRNHQAYIGFPAGLMAGLAALAHPTGLVLDAVVFAALVIFYHKQKSFWQTLFLAFAGFLVLVSIYVGYVYRCIQQPGVDFTDQMMFWAPKGDYLAGEILRWRHFLQWPKGFPLALIYGAAWLAAWYRSGKTEKFLAAIIIIYSLILPFVVINKTSRYLTPLIPFFSILLVRLAVRVWNAETLEKLSSLRIHKVLHKGISAAIIGAYLLITVFATSLMLVKLRNADLDNLLNRLAQTIPSDKTAIGDMMFWMGKTRFRYGPYPLRSSVGSRYDILKSCRKYGYDYAIRTAWNFSSSHGIEPPPENMPPFRTNEFVDVICRHYGTKIDEFRDPYFGPVEIYKLHWNETPD